MRELTPEEQAQLESMTDPEVVKSKFAWDDTFQRRLLAMLLTDDYMLIQSMDKIKPEYFSNESHILICRILLTYFTKEKFRPKDWIISQELTNLLKDRDRTIQLHYQAELKSIYDYYVPGVDSREYLIDKVTYFAKVQAVKLAFHSSLEKMQEAPEDEKTWSFVYEKMREAMLIDRSYEPGLEYFMNIDEMFRRMDDVFVGKDRFTSGFPAIDNALTGGGLFAGQIASWIGLPGTGKSLALVKAAVENVLLGHKVLYITLEMDELGIVQRFTSQFAKKDINNLRDMKDEIKATIEEF
jgi:replicative DNA helicase